MIDEKRFNRDSYKYVYDVKFANYLMLQDIKCKGTGISKETGNYFWCFDREEIQPVYERIAFKKQHMADLERQWAEVEEAEANSEESQWDEVPLVW